MRHCTKSGMRAMLDALRSKLPACCALDPARLSIHKEPSTEEEDCSTEASLSSAGISDSCFWDPLGFTADDASEFFRRRRPTELKRGRSIMLAIACHITPEVTSKHPGH